jgi:hypothetical protein
MNDLKRGKGAGAEHDDEDCTQEKHGQFQKISVFFDGFHDNIPPLSPNRVFSLQGVFNYFPDVF